MTKKKKKKQLSPIITMLIMILIVSLASLILSLLNVDSNKTSIVNGVLETSIVVVKNIFSKEGLIYFFSNLTTNINILEPLVLMIVSLMAISVAKSSGLLKHIFLPLKKLKPNILTFFVILISIASTIIGEYNYIILIPLVAVLYQYINRNPALGIITVFLGLTLGYGTGLFYNYSDYALGLLTEEAAIGVDASYKFSLVSNIYIMIASTIAISFLITGLINKYLSKKVTTSDHYEDELVTSKSALYGSLIAFVISIIPIIVLIINGVLLDATQSRIVARLFSSNAPFNLSFIYLFLIVVSIASLVYGLISKNFKNNHEFSWGFTKEFNNLGYLFILMFLSSIIIGIIDWTNIGVVVVNKLVSLISLFNFTGIPLIVITFICIIIMSILMPNNLEKWALISPILVPLFMKGNLTPDFTQFLFKVADSVGKIISPVFIYFIVMIGFIQKYNTKENSITLFNTMKLISPIVLIMIIFWLLILIIWYIAGLPLGIGALSTM